MAQGKATQEKRGRGKPALLYTLEVGEKICALISEGMPLTKIVLIEGMPKTTTIFKWLNDNEDFAKLYAHAKELQADYLADEIAALADEKPRTFIDNSGAEKIDPAWVNNQKNRIDARKWTASKLKPHKYGDALNLNHSGKVELTDEQIESRLTKLLGKAGIVGADGAASAEEKTESHS